MPDGVGATAKKAIDCIISVNTEDPAYCVNDLISAPLMTSPNV